VGEDIAIERVQGGVIDVRCQHALAQIVEDDDFDRPAEPTERLLVQLGPAACARGESQEPDALAAVAQGEDEPPRAAILARVRVAHHRAVAVVDLAFLARRGDDERMRIGGPRPAQAAHEAAHAGVLAWDKSDPISLDTVSTTMTGAKEVADGREKAEADSWQ